MRAVAAEIPLRLLLEAQPKLVAPVLQVVHRVIRCHLLRPAGLKDDPANSGAVTLIQRFGSAANLNINLHCLVLDGVYRRGADGVREFVEVPAPTDEALQAVLHKITNRTMKLLARRGMLVEAEGSTSMADICGDSEKARSLRPLQAISRYCCHESLIEPEPPVICMPKTGSAYGRRPAPVRLARGSSWRPSLRPPASASRC